MRFAGSQVCASGAVKCSSCPGDAALIPQVVASLEQVSDDVRSAVITARGGHQAGQEAKILTKSNEGRLGGLTGAPLGQADRGGQPVAQAPAADRVLDLAALAEIGLDGLGRAAVANPAIAALVWGPQVAKVAQPSPGGVDLVVGQRAGQLGHLERESGRRAVR